MSDSEQTTPAPAVGGCCGCLFGAIIVPMVYVWAFYATVPPGEQAPGSFLLMPVAGVVAVVCGTVFCLVGGLIGWIVSKLRRRKRREG